MVFKNHADVLYAETLNISDDVADLGQSHFHPLAVVVVTKRVFIPSLICSPVCWYRYWTNEVSCHELRCRFTLTKRVSISSKQRIQKWPSVFVRGSIAYRTQAMRIYFCGHVNSSHFLAVKKVETWLGVVPRAFAKRSRRSTSKSTVSSYIHAS